MSRRLWAVYVSAGIALAVALRVWVLAAPFGAVDSDEAVWGLMARHVLDGELSAFFWGQAYGGTQEVLLTAPVFGVAGSGEVTLRLVPLVLFAAATQLVWRLGRWTIGEPGARIGAVVFALWPAYLVWKSTKAHGFYGSALVLTLLVLLLAVRLAERDSAGDLAAVGLAAGLGWWATPQTAFVVVPAVAWLVWQRPGVLRRAWLPAAAAVVGALPWLVWNAGHDWESFTAPFGRGGDTYLDHLRTFFYATFPTILGLRVPFSLDWLTGEPAGRLLEVGALAGFAWRAYRRHTLLLVVLVAYPLLQAASPYGSLNEEPRYLVLLAPVLALLAADLLAGSSWSTVTGTAGLAALTIAGLVSMGRQDPPVPPIGGQRTPADLGPVLDLLERNGVRRMLAPYEIAYRITFETRERVIASSTGQVRHKGHDRLVRRSRNPAYVFARFSPAATVNGRKLRARGYRSVETADWTVYLAPPYPPRRHPPPRGRTAAAKRRTGIAGESR